MGFRMPSQVSVEQLPSGNIKLLQLDWKACFIKTKFETVPLMSAPFEVNPWVSFNFSFEFKSFKVCLSKKRQSIGAYFCGKRVFPVCTTLARTHRQVP